MLNAVNITPGLQLQFSMLITTTVMKHSTHVWCDPLVWQIPQLLYIKFHVSAQQNLFCIKHY